MVKENLNLIVKQNLILIPCKIITLANIGMQNQPVL